MKTKNTQMSWALAQWMLAIWDPSKMDFIQEPKRRRRLRLHYLAKGIVLHDRLLCGRKPL